MASSAPIAKKDPPLRVELPSAKDDRALTSKVGIVAIVGFGLGILWPRLLGWSVGPDVPGAHSPPPATSSKIPQAPVEAPAANGSAATPEDDASGAPEDGPTNKQTVFVGDGKVDSCKNKKNDKLDDCGKVSFDKIAKARLAELARCPAAMGLEGSMSLAVTLNFDKNEVVVDGEKKKSGLPSETVRGVLVCAGKELKGVELEKIPHTHLKYTLVYDLSFYPPGKAPAAGDNGGEAADAEGEEGLGRATVAWEKALVRATPDNEGKILSRLPQGTRVKLLEKKDNWYRIEAGKKKGWVYNQAIGK